MKANKLKPLFALCVAAGVAACGGETTDLVSQIQDGLKNDVKRTKKITSDPTYLGGRGSWGGLVLSGYGKVNNGDSNAQTTSEAVPDGVTRYFGGTDNADSSGSLKYIVLAETGEAFRPDEEVQGLTVEAAGSGTTISYLQVTNSDDDGVEWFGGASKADHLVISGVSDDSLDIDLGYQGTIQYALVIQGENFGDRTIESDSNGSDFGADPKSKPVMANLTLIGDHGNEDSTGNLHREGFGGQVFRSVYTDNQLTGGVFGKGCVDVDDELDEELFYGDVVFNCSAGIITEDDDTFANDFLASSAFDHDVDASLTIDSDTLAVAATWNKTDYSSELAAAGLDDTDYVGAIDPNATTAWWDGWTIRHGDIDGNLPGADFHPLQAEIEDGTLAPAAENKCGEINADFAAGEPVTIFGKSFPVCVISKTILADTTLSADHVYLLDGTVTVGNGDVESASDKGSVTKVKLSIDAGTQVFGITETTSSLVISRGSQVYAEGTAELPIIFGGVDAENVN